MSLERAEIAIWEEHHASTRRDFVAVVQTNDKVLLLIGPVLTKASVQIDQMWYV